MQLRLHSQLQVVTVRADEMEVMTRPPAENRRPTGKRSAARLSVERLDY